MERGVFFIMELKNTLSQIFETFKRILRYTFVTLFLLCGIMSFYANDFFGIGFILLACIISPLFDRLCQLININISINSKLLICLGTFFISAGFSNSQNLAGYIVIIAIYWIIILCSLKFKQKRESLEQVRLEKERLERERFKKEIFEQHKKVIIRNFNNLDVFMIRTIGKMANAIHNSDLNNELFGKVNLSDIIIDFCKDTNDLDDIDIKFPFDDPDYLKEKINKHFTEFEKFIIRTIKPVFPDTYKWEVDDIYYDLTKMISDNSSIYMSAFLSELMGSEKIELNFNLKPIYADSKILKYYTNFINIVKYIIYLLLTGMCIAKLIFIEKKIRKLGPNNEFYKIIYNMARELKDIDLIIEKTRPLYNEFYKDVLDFIDDDILYRIAITMMVNKINSEKQINNSNRILDPRDTKIYTI